VLSANRSEDRIVATHQFQILNSNLRRIAIQPARRIGAIAAGGAPLNGVANVGVANVAATLSPTLRELYMSSGKSTIMALVVGRQRTFLCVMANVRQRHSFTGTSVRTVPVRRGVIRLPHHVRSLYTKPYVVVFIVVSATGIFMMYILRVQTAKDTTNKATGQCIHVGEAQLVLPPKVA
jgi:hypothetical protein